MDNLQQQKENNICFNFDNLMPSSVIHINAVRAMEQRKAISKQMDYFKISTWKVSTWKG